MASERALALRRANVQDRLTAAAARIAPDATPPQWSKDPLIAGIERLEWLAGLLDCSSAPPAPADELNAARQQLAETTVVAADLQAQLEEAPHGDPGPAPAHQSAPPAAAPEAATRAATAPARKGR